MLTSCRGKLNNNISEDGLLHDENFLYYYVDGQLVIPKTKYVGSFVLHAIAHYFCLPQKIMQVG